MLVAVYCAPHQSWTNPVEHCMPIVNLALQNVALEHRLMVFEIGKNCLETFTALQSKSHYLKRPVWSQ